MKVKVRRVGNSLTVTIPKEIAMDLGLGPDVEMDVSMRDGAVVLDPAGSRWDRLVAEVRRQAAERGLTERDVDLAVAEARDRET
ncbi:MAG: AbrB/MazE/SpoVT family DNA-binding domain-containing protein [bacterium]